MSIDDLRNEVQKNTKVTIKYVNDEEKHIYHLSSESPTNTDLKNIYVLNSLSDSDKIQAEAHELGHFLVKSRGIIAFQSNYPYEPSYFALELNNAISHKHVINILRDEFDISSDLHLTLRKNCVNKIEEQIIECNDKYLLYGIGMVLYDINVTTGEDIEKFTEMDTQVKEAVNVAKRWLSQIEIDMPREKQEEIIKNMLKELKIPEGKLSIL